MKTEPVPAPPGAIRFFSASNSSRSAAASSALSGTLRSSLLIFSAPTASATSHWPEPTASTAK